MKIISLPLPVIATNFSSVLQCPSLYVDIFSEFTFIELKHRSHVLLSVTTTPVTAHIHST